MDIEELENDEKLKRNFKEYPETVSMALRCRINSNKLSLILNCFCLDNDMDDSEFLSPEKLRTAMLKHGKKVVEKHEKQKDFEAIGSDSKKSLVAVSPGKSVMKDKHTAVNMANGDYIDHWIGPGTGFAIANAFYKVSKNSCLEESKF